jgi:hypothetical protein
MHRNKSDPTGVTPTLLPHALDLEYFFEYIMLFFTKVGPFLPLHEKKGDNVYVKNFNGRAQK